MQYLYSVCYVRINFCFICFKHVLFILIESGKRDGEVCKDMSESFDVVLNV